MTQRRYDEEEVALILHNATENTVAEPDAASAGGLTLAELKEIGTEAGIDVSRIEAAAKALTPRWARAAEASSTGLVPIVQQERVVPARVDADNLPHLLDLIRNEFGRQGIVEEVFGGMEWRASSVMGGRYVSIRGEGNSTRVRVLGNFRDGLLVFGLGPGPMLAIAGGLLAGGLGAAPLLVGLAAALGWGSAFLPWRYLYRRERKGLRQVLDAIERRIRELA